MKYRQQLFRIIFLFFAPGRKIKTRKTSTLLYENLLHDVCNDEKKKRNETKRNENQDLLFEANSRRQ